MIDISEEDRVWFATWRNPTPGMLFFTSFVSLDKDFKIVRHSIVMKTD